MIGWRLPFVLGTIGTLVLLIALIVLARPGEIGATDILTTTISTPREGQRLTNRTVSITGLGKLAATTDTLAKVQIVVITGTVNTITGGTPSGWSFDAALGTRVGLNTPFTATWTAPAVGATNYTIAARAVANVGGVLVNQSVLTFVRITVATDEPTPTPSAVARAINVPAVGDAIALVPTPVVVPSPSPPASPTPGTDVVKNGTFSSDLLPSWQAAGQLGASWLPASTLTGGAARIGSRTFDSCGGVPANAYGQIAQLVTIPNRDGVFLRFNYLMTTQDILQADDGTPIDSFEVYVVPDATAMPTGVIDDSDRVFRDGRPKGTVTIGCTDAYITVPASGMGSAAIDLSALRGQRVWLVFQVWNRFDNYLNSIVDLDNVSIS